MNINEYVKQLSIVILGILIAFWISNLSANYKEQDTQKQVLRTILNEVTESNCNIRITISSLDSLGMTYSCIRNNDTASNAFTINYLGLQLKSIGYETAKYTGILKDVNYKLTSKIVENYESQISLERAEKLLVDELYVSIKNRVSRVDDIDYILLLIQNFRKNLESFDIEQKKLIEDLSVALN